MSKLTPVAWFRWHEYNGWQSTSYHSLAEWEQDLEVAKETMSEDDYSTEPPVPLFTEAQLNQARADALREAAEALHCKRKSGIEFCAEVELRRMAEEIEKGSEK